MANPKNCLVQNCTRLSAARGMCQAHLRRVRLYGSPMPEIEIGKVSVLFRKARPFKVILFKGERCIKLPLTKGDFTILDIKDRWATEFKWYSLKGKYALRREGGLPIYLHREILKAPDHLEVDHVNRNGLDNRRSNLRLATHSQNAVNKEKPKSGTSQFRGVSLYRPRGLWQAQIKVNGKNRGLGHFKSEVSAARAYDKAALLEFGDRAIINFKQHELAKTS